MEIIRFSGGPAANNFFLLGATLWATALDYLRAAEIFKSVAVGVTFSIILLQREELGSRRFSQPSQTAVREPFALDAPTQMQENSTATVNLVVDGYARERVISLMRDEPDLTNRRLYLGELSKQFPIVTATLEGIGFTILPAGPQKRETTLEWTWQIKAEPNDSLSLGGESRIISVRLEGQMSGNPDAKVVVLDGPRPKRVEIISKPAIFLRQVIDLLKDSWPILSAIVLFLSGVVAWIWRHLRRNPDDVIISR